MAPIRYNVPTTDAITIMTTLQYCGYYYYTTVGGCNNVLKRNIYRPRAFGFRAKNNIKTTIDPTISYYDNSVDVCDIAFSTQRVHNK